MKILLDFSAKIKTFLNRELGIKILHEINNADGVRTVNIASSKKSQYQKYNVPCVNICKYTWTSPDGKTHDQIDHILMGEESIQVYLMSDDS
jgi:hypothetical protein